MPPKPDYRDHKKLSLKAKGLYAILLKMKADGQTNFGMRDIARLTSDGVLTIKQGKQELERGGYLKKLPSNDSVTIDGEPFSLPNA